MTAHSSLGEMTARSSEMTAQFVFHLGGSTRTVHIRTVGTALCGLVSGFLNVSGVFRGGSQSVRFLKSAKEPALL